MNCIGIDPGADGAMAIISPSREIRVYRFKDQSEQAIANAIIVEAIQPCEVFLEKVHSMPGQGVATMFAFGRNLGFLRGVLVASAIPFEDIPPQTWQKGVGLGKTYPTQAHRKRAHLQYAQQIFPSIKITLATADAILIAEYKYRTVFRP